MRGTPRVGSGSYIALILDQAETQLIASVGWVEHGAFLVWDLDSDETRRIPVEDAEYVTLSFLAALTTLRSYTTASMGDSAFPSDTFPSGPAPRDRGQGQWWESAA